MNVAFQPPTGNNVVQKSCSIKDELTNELLSPEVMIKVRNEQLFLEQIDLVSSTVI